MPVATQDGRRARGDATRRRILERAADMASVDGLHGLSLGNLAGAVGNSKSGIATLFGSKETLQLATVDAASAVFQRHVVDPARQLPYSMERVATLLRNALDYSRRRVFTGGCFFLAAAADVDSKPGPVHDAVRAWLATWYRYVEIQILRAAEADGLEIDAVRAERLAFTLIALDAEANTRSVIGADDRSYHVAAEAMRETLAAAGARPDQLRPLLLDD